MRTLLLLALFAQTALGQFAISRHPVRFSGGGGGGTYTYYNSTYVSATGTSGTSVTSSALTLSAGDFVAQFCVSGTSGKTLAQSSSPSNTYASLATESSTVGTSLLSYILSAGAGSTTFSCSWTGSSSYNTLIVLAYHHSGGAAALNAGTDHSGTLTVNNTVHTSGTFSTTAAALVVYCVRTTSTANDLVAGNIGSTLATLRTTDGSTSACEDATFATAQTSITSSMTGTANSAASIGGAAFN